MSAKIFAGVDPIAELERNIRQLREQGMSEAREADMRKYLDMLRPIEEGKMSNELATSPRLHGEAESVEGRLADLIEEAEEVRLDDYRLSTHDRALISAALRSKAMTNGLVK
jgi:hypothetical protein